MSDFVFCRDPEEYDVCPACKKRLKQFAYVIEGQSGEERPHPTPDDHYDAVAGAAEFCGGDECANPPSKAEVIDRETTYCSECGIDIGSRFAGTVCEDCGRLYCGLCLKSDTPSIDSCPGCRGEE